MLICLNVKRKVVQIKKFLYLVMTSVLATLLVVAGTSCSGTPVAKGGIEGTVTDLNGKPVTGMRVGIFSGTTGFPEMAPETNDEGYYKIGSVPPGTFELAVFDRKGNRIGLESVVVRSGETSTLNFTISTSGITEISFECTLEAEETYVIGEPVNLRFSLHNQTNYTLYLLTWLTPLEGIAGDIFTITRDGDEILYRGILAKRGDPLRDEYAVVKPGAAVSAVVNLAEYYELSQAGRYHVEFTSRLLDVTNDESLIPRKQDDHQPQELTCNTVSFEVVH